MNSDIAVPTAKYTGPAKQSGIEASAMKKMPAALSAITIMDAREHGRKKINPQREDRI